MSRARILIAALLCLFAGTTATAAAYPAIGFGEQTPEIFSDSNWSHLGLKNVRIVVGWDATSTAWQRNELDPYIASAQSVGAQLLVAFGRSRVPARNHVLPTPSAYRKAFIAFRHRYPSVKQFVVWNEANHCSQPTCHHPERAAEYYNVVRSVCGSCTFVAADVLDTENMPEWIHAFTQKAKSGPKIWGLHNYIDANRFTTHGTDALLHATKGQVWFTETGGVVKRTNRQKITFPESIGHAARATRFVTDTLATRSSRIKRVYFYHWAYAGKQSSWDSAMIDPHGVPRRAYRVLVAALQRHHALGG